MTDIWRKARESHPLDPAASPLLSKLCWAALGYHYDWTARKYYRHSFSAVPKLLQQLGARCASACGMTLSAEAVIVNFYKSKSAMGGHLDDVEYTMDHPVVSLSLGSCCVFLMGGHTKDDPPLEILLRSGDIAIMGGESRTCYHGVARVLPTPFDLPSDAFDALPQGEDDREDSEQRASTVPPTRAHVAQMANVEDRCSQWTTAAFRQEKPEFSTRPDRMEDARVHRAMSRLRYPFKFGRSTAQACAI
ncbi:hypothetical protein ON010_g17611 [Phytophthora cinnamomi]|nr:hypothetical protein ON010_g17611 [Phytophthora cinnamomi]